MNKFKEGDNAVLIDVIIRQGKLIKSYNGLKMDDDSKSIKKFRTIQHTLDEAIVVVNKRFKKIKDE